MKKFLSVIIFDKLSEVGYQRTLRDLFYLKNILKKNEKIYILDLRKYCLSKTEGKKFHIKNKKFIYFRPRNISSLKNFLKNKKIFASGPISPNLRTILIFLIIKFLGIKLIFINHYGYYLNENIKKEFSIKDKIFYFYHERFSYYLCRILSVLNILPIIDFCFESSQERINFINTSFSKKIEKFIPFFKFSYFKKIYRINSIYYDEMLVNKQSNVQKNIVLVDTGLGHIDSTKKDPDSDKIKDLDIINFYSKIIKLLYKISRKTSSKIYFCKHPKSYYPKDCFKKFKKLNINLNADQHIWSAKYVFFTGGSSMVNKAIMLRKNIIVLISDKTQKFSLRLLNSINKLFKLNYYYLDGKRSKNNKVNFLNYKKKKYDNFIYKNLIFKKHIHSSKIIREKIFGDND